MNNPEHNKYTTHQEVWKLLPWYVNGSAESQEKALIKAHLEVCLTCKKELAVLKKIATAVHEAPILAITPDAPYTRLLQQIKQQTTPAPDQSSVTMPSAQVMPLPVRRGRSVPRKIAAWWRKYPVAIAAGLAGLLIVPVALHQSGLNSINPGYHTLASHDNLAGSTQHDLHIVFTADITQERIKQTLAALNSQIIAGPNKLGMYTIRLQADQNSRILPIATALSQLRQQPGIIMAEPVLPPRSTN